jgi:autotransporter-associated beta strand protein
MVTTSSLRAQSGVWTANSGGNASGSWATAGNWSGGTIAAGADSTANFSTLDITDLSVVTLDGARTIGSLVFGDTTPSTNWFLNTGSAGPLTLAVSSGAPTITVNNQAATLGVAIAGSAGLTKLGDGTLVLTNTGNSALAGNITVSAGMLTAAAGNSALGAASDGLGVNLVTVTGGGTLRLNPNVAINNKQLHISGTGAGGTNGALFADSTATSNGTRWGIGGSTALVPFLTLDADATLRVDGDATTVGGASFLLHSININGFNLTKTGTGRLTFDQANRVSGDGLVHVVQGVLGFRAGSFSGGRSLTVDTGAEARITGDNNAMSSTVNAVTINGKLDLNARGSGTVGSDTTTFNQTIGLLTGSGTITSGTFGNIGNQTLNISHDSSANSTFDGSISQINGKVFLVKAGDNVLTLNGSNSYSGLTTINGGVLTLNGTNTGLGGYLINAGTLNGKGTLSSPITNTAGALEAGDPASPGGTLLVTDIIGSGGDTINISNATLAVSGYIGANAMTVGTLNMTNGTLKMPLRTLGASAALVTFNVDGNARLQFTMDTPLVGQFALVSYSSLGGLAGFSGLSLLSPAGITATLVNNTANSTIDVNITAIPAQTWTGTPNGNWDIGTTANWSGGITYNEPAGSGPFVVFNDTAPGTTTVNLTTTLSPKGVTLNNTSKDYTFQGSGHLSGPGGIAKQGSGTLTVATSGNDFAGGVQLQQGTLRVGSGGTTGDLGSGAVANQATLALNRSDSFTLPSTVSGNGNITKAGAGTATVPVSGDSTGAVTVSAGALQLAPSGTSKFSGNVTGVGAFGVNGAGTLVLNGLNNTYSGGTLIGSGTLQFGDEVGSGALPPTGSITDNGTLATTLYGTLANNISGSGGITILNNAAVTLGGVNSYTGPTVVLGTLDASAASLPAASALTLGSLSGGAETGTLNFPAGNLVLGGLRAGGNGTPSAINLTASQSLTVNGNLVVGNTSPSAASVGLSLTGTGLAIAVVTNGGTIQLGLGTAGSGVNPDNVVVDFSTADQFIASLGTNGVINLGTLDGNPGPQAGATVVNQFKLATVSNSITAGTITVGAGGRQLVPELILGDGTNVVNVNTFTAGGGGRDGSYVHFNSGTGGLQLRGNDGASRAAFNVGVNPGTTTGASITNTVDFTGHPANLLLSSLVIGNYNNAGVYENRFSFDAGTLDALTTSLSVQRSDNASAALSGSTLNIGGGTAALGAVNLTASAAYGTLTVANATSLSVSNITSPGAGLATFDINNTPLALQLGSAGGLATPAIGVDVFNASGAVPIAITGTGFTVGTHVLIKYTGAIGGSGYSALSLGSLPAGVTATLADNTANASVDLVVTAAPALVNLTPTNLVSSVSGTTLNLSWPGDHKGWTLQTNAVSVADPSQWFAYPGSAGVTNVAITINPVKTNVFFRLVYPLGL